ncbi:MAG: FeoB small GTPase domain-containing protein, partial [Methanobacteriaceae archaeon]
MQSALLVGSPNVGKSLIFNKLTGLTATVANYPGTTVDIDKGKFNHNNKSINLVDPPGMYDLNTITEEERISKLLILSNDYDLMIHVIDAKNIDRSIGLTLQLIDAGKKVILVLNMIDELEKIGGTINKDGLIKKLGIPVILTTAIKNKGIDDLKNTITDYPSIKNKIISSSKHSSEDKISVNYGQAMESAINNVEYLLKSDYHMSKRAIAILLLENDDDIKGIVKEKENNYKINSYENIDKLVKEARNKFDNPIKYLTKLRLSKYGEELKNDYTNIKSNKVIENISISEKLSRLMIKPVSGLLILFVILYFGLYQFVGVLGAGELVDLLESQIFGEYINPFITTIVTTYVPWEAI